jgi:hypothetical protein
VERTVPPRDRHAIAVRYLERLIDADLRVALSRAVKANDPALPGLLRAMSAFLEQVPPAVRRDTRVIADAIVIPTLRQFDTLSANAQGAFLDLVRSASRGDPGLLDAVPGRAASTELRIATAMPTAVGARLLALAIRARPPADRRRVSGAGDLAPRPVAAGSDPTDPEEPPRDHPAS